MLALSEHGPAFRSADAALAQVGWIGQTGAVYALHDPPRAGREPGSYEALYVRIGTYVPNGRGGVLLED
ncbi:hypothetical protein [Amycolatopsis sp. NPDC004079]|uniref:hypothetical protein n=1 Tax=Amycolatopsis sp. NPDC004079 TaxID=3154549 RepID=UPI0033BDA5C1